jgi:hypothetical protein
MTFWCRRGDLAAEVLAAPLTTCQHQMAHGMNRHAVDNADISNTSWTPPALLVQVHPNGHHLRFFRKSDHVHRRVETGKRNGGAPTSCARKT